MSSVPPVLAVLAMYCLNGCIGEEPGAIAPASSFRAYWRGIHRPLPIAPSRNQVAIVCHNCYEDRLQSSEANTRATLERIHAAQEDGADLIELDVKLEQESWRIGHSDDGSLAAGRFADIVLDERLRLSDQPMFIEFKEQDPPSAQIDQLLAMAANAGLMGARRPLVLRAFSTRRLALERTLAVLNSRDERNDVRLHLLFRREETEDAGLRARLNEAVRAGFDGIEFDRQSSNILAALQTARELGLGTNVWGLDERVDLASCSAFRDVSSAITIDFGFARCRATIEGGGR